ncbi:MAG TPA: thiamine phosphate synthase [Aeromicrobium sp.]|nr:thiamine phosphate synthase [Aeromicrobium sp.]
MTSRLLLLTDRTQLPPGRELLPMLADCAAAGASLIVIREHDLPVDERHALLAGVAELPGVTAISSRIADPAAALVHLGADQSVPPGRWHARSCHSEDDVDRAGADGALYATLSPFTETASKPGYGPPLDRSVFAHRSGVPVFALGGITPANAPSAIEAGAHGVAVMGAVMRAVDPAGVVAALLGATA